MLRVVLSLLACCLVASTKEAGSIRKHNLPPEEAPTVTINLDLPPKERFAPLAKANPKAVEGMIASCPAMRDLAGHHDADQWVKHHNIPEEYVLELQGIVEALPDMPGLTLDCLILLNLLYDVRVGLPGKSMCTGVLAAMRDGTVVHGRTSDFSNPDGVLWPGFYKATFTRGGKPLYVSALIMPVLGVHTGMRFDGYTVEQNTRNVGISGPIDLAAAERGGMSAFIGARYILENVPDFSTAVNTFATQKWQSAQFWILAGKDAYDGAVITVSAVPEHGKAPRANIEILDRNDRWYLVQTNSDPWGGEPLDAVLMDYASNSQGRFDAAVHALATTPQSTVSQEWVTNLMLTPPIQNDETIYTVEAVPAKNVFRIMLPPLYHKYTDHPSLSLLSRRRSLKV
mmetsp:Transcript_70332/g.150601  ORF Transcript_70332/g.150601 Transcript_70332/m.150601 type:complete len:399 (+) Transcript_70332:70-1266(+)